MSERILVLHTGGTIGMTTSPQGYQPAADFPAFLHRRLDPFGLPAFDVIALDHLIDSADLNPSDWSSIAAQLIRYWPDYSGFVILHGTDTMAYTASALSFILQGCDKPVIVTGSQVPLNAVRTDAINNLVNSLLLAAHPDISEVCVCFHGRLLRGNRSTKVKSTAFDAFDSPDLPWLGEAGVHIHLSEGLLLHPGEPHLRELSFDPAAVSVLALYPGIQADIARRLCAAEGLKGLILRSYGVGNVPQGNQALMDVLAAAVNEGVVVVNTSQCLAGGVYQDTYASGSVLSRIGVTPASDMTAEATFAKLHYLIACGESPEQIRALMPLPLRGECSSPDQQV
ncbi:MAG: L-asparaginase 1 [Oceanospirillaceae bacterium]|nr:L-asparaginase 1 [Oceanospirillaceae bacterium]MAR02186.1 L-asparaginase 1 [Oceanospirillaceae bacterium]|tara:strand:- start:1558 stop:2577 length:1020 start_codon:yes stop_codon:yes gene_type:complete